MESPESVALLFRALSDPNRVRILNFLKNRSGLSRTCSGENTEGMCYCMKDIAASLEITLPTVSHHIRELVQVGLIFVQKKGRFAHCHINPEKIQVAEAYLKTLLLPS
jgi:ArsR family transcriptional regulator